MKRNWHLLPGIFIISISGLIIHHYLTLCWYFSDDFYWIYFGIRSLENPVGIFTHRLFNYYRPVINASFVLESTWAGIEAGPRHLFNLLLHLSSGLLLYTWLRRLTGRIIAALTGCVLFLWGPIQMETVIWISGRTDLTAAFLILLCLVLLPTIDEPESTYSRNPITFLKIGSVIALVLAILSKETAVLTLVAIWVTDKIEITYQQGGRSLSRWIRLRRPWIYCTGMGILLHGFIQLTGEVTFTHLEPSLNILTFLQNWAGGVGLTISQFFPMLRNLDPSSIGTFFILLIIAVFAWYLKMQTTSYGLILTLCFMIPTAAVPFTILPIVNLTFGRFIYIPSIGMALMLSGLMHLCVNSKFHRRFRQSLVVVVFLTFLAFGINNSIGTFDRWNTITQMRKTAVIKMVDQINLTDAMRPVIVIVPDLNIWPEMFELFAGGSVDIVRSPEGISVSDNVVYIFESESWSLRLLTGT